MASTQDNVVYIGQCEKVREYYIEKPALFGLITWHVVQRRESLGRVVYIHIPSLHGIDTVIINGDQVLGPATQ